MSFKMSKFGMIWIFKTLKRYGKESYAPKTMKLKSYVFNWLTERLLLTVGLLMRVQNLIEPKKVLPNE